MRLLAQTAAGQARACLLWEQKGEQKKANGVTDRARHTVERTKGHTQVAVADGQIEDDLGIEQAIRTGTSAE